jgi:adenine-specific DNA-methyltransferase
MVQAELSIELTYPGKVPTEDIISNTKPAQISITEKIGDFNQSDNLLYYGDNLHILKSLLDEPGIKGKVKLVYIDPPFSTKRTFKSENGKGTKHAYHDHLEGYEFIEYLRKRLVLIKELLSDDGAIYIHLDQKTAHYIKVILDEIFDGNFKNWITRQKCHSKNYTKNQYGNVQDFILFYTKSRDNYIWNRPYDPWSEERIKKEYSLIDENGRRYKKVPIYAPGIRNGKTGEIWNGMLPPKGKHWQFVPEKLDELNKNGDIIWSKSGNPRRKVYLDQSKGVPVSDIWLDYKDYYNQNQSVTGYPTEKNEELLTRIINASSNEGDIVLDCFAGSGTTLVASTQLNRKWIGIDNSELSIHTIKERFAKLQHPPSYTILTENEL